MACRATVFSRHRNWVIGWGRRGVSGSVGVPIGRLAGHAVAQRRQTCEGRRRRVGQRLRAGRRKQGLAQRRIGTARIGSSARAASPWRFRPGRSRRLRVPARHLRPGQPPPPHPAPMRSPVRARQKAALKGLGNLGGQGVEGDHAALHHLRLQRALDAPSGSPRRNLGVEGQPIHRDQPEAARQGASFLVHWLVRSPACRRRGPRSPRQWTAQTQGAVFGGLVAGHGDILQPVALKRRALKLQTRKR